MRTRRTERSLGVMALLVVMGTTPAWAQFSSGSTGALGALNPASNTTITLPADGILNYTTITIPAGVTVTFTRNTANTPVTMLATGNVSISGTISVKGVDAIAGPTSGSWSPTLGRDGGPGGYDGGDGGIRGASPTNGQAGKGPGGGRPGQLPAIHTHDGLYAADVTFVTLIPLFGGSGGGGGVGSATANGAAGGGGGGAIVIASTTQISIAGTGVVTAEGGSGISPCFNYGGGAGSGGAVRLVAPTVSNLGGIYARGGNNSCVGGASYGYAGKVRLECTTCTSGTIVPAASVSNTLGPVAPASTPALTNLPTLTFSTIGGASVPGSPTGKHETPDLTIPVTTANPVNVVLAATNVPVPMTFTVKVIPRVGEPTYFPSGFSTGTTASSTATAAVRLPPGMPSVLTAFVQLAQAAAVLPTIDGEPVEQVLLAAGVGEASSLSLVLRSGRTIPVAALSPVEQQQVALALAAR